jgi:hypothetical protein
MRVVLRPLTHGHRDGRAKRRFVIVLEIGRENGNFDTPLSRSGPAGAQLAVPIFALDTSLENHSRDVREF